MRIEVNMSKTIKTIVCVDDDESILKILKLTLERSELYKVITFDNGNDFLNSVKNISPQGILLDMNMPDMNGVELFNALRNIPELDSIPIGFLTAETSTEMLDEFMSLGAVATITKPIDTEMLTYQVAFLFGDQVDDNIV